jgi:hypothetical protein
MADSVPNTSAIKFSWIFCSLIEDVPGHQKSLSHRQRSEMMSRRIMQIVLGRNNSFQSASNRQALTVEVTKTLQQIGQRV